MTPATHICQTKTSRSLKSGESASHHLRRVNISVPTSSRLEVMGQLEELSLSVLEQLAEILGEEHDKKTKTTKRVVVQLTDRRRTLPDGRVVCTRIR